MKIERLEDIEFVFSEKEDDGFLKQASKPINVGLRESGFSLDTAVLYRKGTIGDLAHIFLKKLNLSDQEFKTRVFKGLTFVLLWTIDPKKSRLFLSSENEHTEIQKFLYDEMGSQFFYKMDVERNSILEKIISSLEVEKLITIRDNKYYLSGYYLDSLILTNIKE